MRILAFDHFYGQDLDAIEVVLPPSDRLTRIPYRRWHRMARRCFPDDAFNGLARAFDDDLAAAWEKYRVLVEREVDWVSRAYRPDLFLVPSDSFFYIRPIIESFRRRGVPTFVAQKETTISPMVMADHSLQVGHYVPFISEFMTVCSERHREFWLRAGTDPSVVQVTGQPRFDVYSGRHDRGSGLRKRLLYLSYDDVAYLPTDVGAEFEGDWRELRCATEACIDAVSGVWDVVVKKHPQQGESDTVLGVGVTVAGRGADTRKLILDADVVVGFQTTALFEAVVAGKPVVYAAWGPTFERVRSTLIQFEGVEGMVTWVRSPEELASVLALEPDEIPLAGEKGMAEAVVHLGPVDGGASQRVVDLMRPLARSGSVGRIGWRHFAERISSLPIAVSAWVGARALRSIRPLSVERLGRLVDDHVLVAREFLRVLKRVENHVEG